MSIVFPGYLEGKGGTPLPPPAPPRAPPMCRPLTLRTLGPRVPPAGGAVTPEPLSQPAGEAAVIDLPPCRRRGSSPSAPPGCTYGPGPAPAPLRLRGGTPPVTSFPARSTTRPSLWSLAGGRGVGRPPITSGHTGISRCPSTSSRASSRRAWRPCLPAESPQQAGTDQNIHLSLPFPNIRKGPAAPCSGPLDLLSMGQIIFHQSLEQLIPVHFSDQRPGVIVVGDIGGIF